MSSRLGRLAAAVRAAGALAAAPISLASAGALAAAPISLASAGALAVAEMPLAPAGAFGVASTTEAVAGAHDGAPIPLATAGAPDAAPPTHGAPAPRQLSLEANPFHGTIGFCTRVAPNWRLGFDAGFGFPQIDRTITPSDRDLLDFVHVGGLARYAPPGPWSADLGLRAGLAELGECQSGDCFPGAYLGISAGVFVGWPWIRFGPHLLAARVAKSGERPETAVSVAPLNVGLYRTW